MGKMSDLVGCAWCDEALLASHATYVDVGPLCPKCWWKWRDGHRPPTPKEEGPDIPFDDDRDPMGENTYP